MTDRNISGYEVLSEEQYLARAKRKEQKDHFLLGSFLCVWMLGCFYLLSALGAWLEWNPHALASTSLVV